MFLVLWEFEVKPGSEDSFESIYGPTGAWAQLFASAEGYKETRLLRDVFRARTFVTIDCWRSRFEYEAFRKTFAEQYSALDKAFEAMTAAERHIGSFESES